SGRRAKLFIRADANSAVGVHSPDADLHDSPNMGSPLSWRDRPRSARAEGTKFQSHGECTDGGRRIVRDCVIDAASESSVAIRLGGTSHYDLINLARPGHRWRCDATAHQR